mgnify:FL=1
MKCPKCGCEDCHEFFNEPKEERETRFTPTSLVSTCIGGIIFLVAGIFFLNTTISDTTNSIIRGVVSLFGLLIAILSLLVGAHSHYKQIYKVKVLCKKCGYQYILEQADIPAINYTSRKAGKMASQATDEAHVISETVAENQHSGKNIIDENGYLRHNDVENKNKK